MKKENRKMAQQRRAAERARKAKQQKIMKIIGIAIPIVIALLIVILIISSIVSSVKAKKAAAAESTETTVSETVSETADTQAEEDSSEASLDTTEGLEAEDGDTVNIAFTGYLDGEAFEGGSSDSYDLTLGSGTFIDGFEEGIVGHTVGETFDLDLTFPENYGNSDLAGQDVVFTVTLNGIYQ